MIGLQNAILEVLETAIGDLSEYELMRRLAMRGHVMSTGELHATLCELRDEGRVCIAWRETTDGYTAFVHEAVAA